MPEAVHCVAACYFPGSTAFPLASRLHKSQSFFLQLPWIEIILGILIRIPNILIKIIPIISHRILKLLEWLLIQSKMRMAFWLHIQWHRQLLPLTVCTQFSRFLAHILTFLSGKTSKHHGNRRICTVVRPTQFLQSSWIVVPSRQSSPLYRICNRDRLLG